MLWREVADQYTAKGRHYHNFDHLADVLEQLQPVISDDNANVMVLATIYHDIIYSITAKDNEERSAALAVERLAVLQVPATTIKEVELCILATKHHQPTGNTVADLFTDADMSILGRNEDTYATYARNVRKEYSLYPDLLYNPGRKKVLQSFLAMDRIFKTEHFYALYEQQARQNVAWEITTL